MHSKSWALAVAVSFAASSVTADAVHPRIYYPREVKRSYGRGSVDPDLSQDKRDLFSDLFGTSSTPGKTSTATSDSSDDGIVIAPTGIVVPGLVGDSTTTGDAATGKVNGTSTATEASSTKTTALDTSSTTDASSTAESTTADASSTAASSTGSSTVSSTDTPSGTASVTATSPSTTASASATPSVTSSAGLLDPIISDIFSGDSSDTATTNTTATPTASSTSSSSASLSLSLPLTETTSPSATSSESASATESSTGSETVSPSATASSTSAPGTTESGSLVTPTPTSTPVSSPSFTETIPTVSTSPASSASVTTPASSETQSPSSAPVVTPQPSSIETSSPPPVVTPSITLTTSPKPIVTPSNTLPEETTQESPSVVPTPIPVPIPSSSDEATKSTVTSIRPTATFSNTEDWLPTSIVADPTSFSYSRPTAVPTNTEPEPLPSDIPQVILPNNPNKEKPADSTEIQVAFDYALNYNHVAKNTVAAAQIFTYLPAALAYAGGFDLDKVQVSMLVPYDTRSEWGYVTTLAKVWYPKSKTDQLSVDLLQPNSDLYNDPKLLVRELTKDINPNVDIWGNIIGGDTQNNNGGGGGNKGDNGGNDALDSGSDSGSTKQQATTAGIAVGALGLAGLYGAAMFVVARRYKRKRQGHRRTSSITGSDASSDMQFSGNGSPALMGGALNPQDASTYGANGRTSQNSNGHSARTANISAPVAAENSLGWN